jgi:hypothetical protein
MGIHPELANVDLAVYGDLVDGRDILHTPPASGSLERMTLPGVFSACALM